MGKKFKFDVVIGNPPYQDESIGGNTKTPSIYNYFLENSYKISPVVEMIHPARFLFNAGDTEKKWNKKMLSDEHLKVLYYEPDSKKIFPGTDIKGGIAITYRNENQIYDPIKFFSRNQTINQILHKVLTDEFIPLSTIVYSPVAYKFTVKMHEDYPELINKLSKGNELEVKTNVFETIPEVFHDICPDNKNTYISILGRVNNKRVYKFIRSEYISNNTNLNFFKVAIPEANGTGKFGEIISDPRVEGKNIGFTQTFITIGKFSDEEEALNLLKYIKSKFCRSLLGTLKVTQHTSISAWKHVPIQEFSNASDIDWTKSIHEIDLQLYKKYNLSDEEIQFIESHVKEMA